MATFSWLGGVERRDPVKLAPSLSDPATDTAMITPDRLSPTSQVLERNQFGRDADLAAIRPCSDDLQPLDQDLGSGIVALTSSRPREKQK